MVDNFTYLFHHGLPGFSDKIEQYYNLTFDVIDANGDGQISLDEYSVYQNSFGIHNRDYIEHIFHKTDLDGDGCISRAEFGLEVMDYCFEDALENIPEMYDYEQAKNFKKK